MEKSEVVFDLIAKMLGMEGMKAELRVLMDLYMDAREEDMAAEPMADPGCGATVGPDGEEPTEPEAAQELEEAEAAPEPEPEPVGKAAEPAGRERPETGGEPTTYTGFLHLKCPSCGAVKTFCAKEPMKGYRCQGCGERVPLETLTVATLDCECGKRARYFTNRTEWGFDIPCVACGAPVAVEYRNGKDRYGTIGRCAARGRK